MYGSRYGAVYGALMGSAMLASADDEGAVGAPPSVAGLVWIGTSQSNGGGKATATSMTDYPEVVNPLAAVPTYERGDGSFGSLTAGDEWTGALQPRPSQVGNNVIGTCGIELTMMRRLHTLVPNGWYLGKTWVDSTGLEDEWVANAANFTDVQKSKMDQQIAAWGAPLKAFVAVLGETDASENPDAGNSYANMLTLYTALRTAYGNDFAIVIVVVSNQFTDAAADGTGTVRQAHFAFCAQDPKARFLQVDHIDGKEIAFLEGTTGAHYTANTCGYVGEAVADLILEMLQATPRAAPRFKGCTHHSLITSANPIVPTMPQDAAYAVGDLMLMVVSAFGNTNYSTPTGWTELSSSPQHNGGAGGNARLQIWGKIVDAVPVSAPSVADVGGDDFKLTTVMWFSGVKNDGGVAGAIDATAGSTAATSTSVTFDGVTTSVANCLVVNVIAHHVDTNVPQLSGWANADLTERREYFDEDRNSSVGYGYAAWGGIKATAGAVAATTATLGATSTQALITLALRAP